MNEEEYAVLLQVVRQNARDHGRSDLDAALFRSRLQDTRSNREAVLAYLLGLRDDFALRNEANVRETARRLAEFRTEKGGRVEGLVVDINDQDRVVFGGRTQVDLLEFAESSDALSELDELITDIEGEDVR